MSACMTHAPTHNIRTNNARILDEPAQCAHAQMHARLIYARARTIRTQNARVRTIWTRSEEEWIRKHSDNIWQMPYGKINAPRKHNHSITTHAQKCAQPRSNEKYAHDEDKAKRLHATEMSQKICARERDNHMRATKMQLKICTTSFTALAANRKNVADEIFEHNHT